MLGPLSFKLRVLISKVGFIGGFHAFFPTSSILSCLSQGGEVRQPGDGLVTSRTPARHFCSEDFGGRKVNADGRSERQGKPYGPGQVQMSIVPANPYG